MNWKHPPDLRPGDRVNATAPGAGEARVVKSYLSEKTMCAPFGKEAHPRNPEAARAWIIVFEMVTGQKRGRQFSSFNHPTDKVALL